MKRGKGEQPIPDFSAMTNEELVDAFESYGGWEDFVTTAAETRFYVEAQRLAREELLRRLGERS